MTNSQYLAFVQAADHESPRQWEGRKPPQGKYDHPIVNVSWHDAMAYCKWLAEITGKDFRLPSEAEWEKAARGTGGRIYPWGDEWDAGRCNTDEDDKGGTTPVGNYPQGASPYGLLDMIGNVWEWCHSLYRPYPYSATDGREDSEAKGKRVLRGGSFLNLAWYARCAVRGGYDPSSEFGYLGFRIVSARGLRNWGAQGTRIDY